MSNTIDSHIDLEQISSFADSIMNSMSIDDPTLSNSTDILNNYPLPNNTFPLPFSPPSTSTTTTTVASSNSQSFQTNNYITDELPSYSINNDATEDVATTTTTNNNNHSFIPLTPTSSVTNTTSPSTLNNYPFPLQ